MSAPAAAAALNHVLTNGSKAVVSLAQMKKRQAA
jgi:hypothetical protein